MQKIIAAAAVASMLLLSACATVKGLGRDIESLVRLDRMRLTKSL